jgi:hypothetical protein
MRKIWKILKEHLASDFHVGMYLSLLAFLTISIGINYSLDLENSYIDQYTGQPIRIFWYFVLHTVGYFVAILIVLGYKKKLFILKTPRFWLYSLTGLVILSWNLGFPYLTTLVRWMTTDPRLFVWAYKCTSNGIDFLTSTLPLFVFAIIINDEDRFGVNRKQIDLSPYWQLLLVIVPIIAIGSFESGFKNYYPSYKQNVVAEVMNWPALIPPFIYEVLYGMDFFNVEFLYRGFFVIGMAKVLGKEAILPMVCSYCFLHFGKPLGESISSIFGGYMLGVVAFYTRNIWGGVMVHIGLAWMMELAAFLQKLD